MGYQLVYSNRKQKTIITYQKQKVCHTRCCIRIYSYRNPNLIKNKIKNQRQDKKQNRIFENRTNKCNITKSILVPHVQVLRQVHTNLISSTIQFVDFNFE